jgi:transposase
MNWGYLRRSAVCQRVLDTGTASRKPLAAGLISIMQFAENLTDRQAADAVRARIDWKYALGLELTDLGFHYSVLSEFRDRLIEGGIEMLLTPCLQ